MTWTKEDTEALRRLEPCGGFVGCHPDDQDHGGACALRDRAADHIAELQHERDVLLAQLREATAAADRLTDELAQLEAEAQASVAAAPITLRDLYASSAIAGILSRGGSAWWDPPVAARLSFEVADAMAKARGER